MVAQTEMTTPAGTAILNDFANGRLCYSTSLVLSHIAQDTSSVTAYHCGDDDHIDLDQACEKVENDEEDIEELCLGSFYSHILADNRDKMRRLRIEVESKLTTVRGQVTERVDTHGNPPYSAESR